MEEEASRASQALVRLTSLLSSPALGLGDEEQRRTMAIHLVAGASARITSVTLMYPVDCIKTRLQVDPTRYANPVEAFRKIVAAEGVAALYKGIPARMLYVAPAAAVSFAVYEEVKSALRPREGHAHWLSPLVPLAAGFAARVFGTATRTPFDVVKQRLQVQGSSAGVYKGTVDAFRTIARSEGLRGMFAGYGVTLLRDAPFAMIYFTSYELFKRAQGGLRAAPADAPAGRAASDPELGTGNFLLAGAAAGVLASTCTSPLDVIKTRLQTQGMRQGGRQYAGLKDAVATIWREEGARGFTRGLAARYLYIAPAASITFTAYENYKRLLEGL
eukprot:tig00021348_g20610.t1